MKNRISTHFLKGVPLALLLVSFAAKGQVPVDDDGNVIGDYSTADTPEKYTDSAAAPTGNEDIPLLSQTELEELVGPVALYPDDLLAIVLPAATYPLQVVQAARFLEDLEKNPALEPNPEWDDSIIALVNYPEVVELLNDDLDWTWRLGEAVVAQQVDVINAVENFRDRAYAAGNLKSDSYQTVSHDDGVIEITPVDEEVIYVPYYEPERVVYYQPRPVYYYYPRAYPVYYYPYPSHYAFNRGFFWGVTTAFTIGWRTDHLHVFHHSYRGHPYFGRSYYDRWWYRRPDIHVYNNVYIRNNVNVSVNRYHNGDYWRPSRTTRLRSTDQRITRNTHYPTRRTATNNTEVRRSVSSNRERTRNVSTNSTSQRETRQQQAGATRNRSQDDMRRSINTVQRDRRASGQSVRRTQQQGSAANTRQSAQRDTAQRNNARRTTTQRDTSAQQNQRRTSQTQPSERRSVSRDEITQRLAMQRDSSNRQSSNRSTTQRRSAERPTVQRQSVQRQTTERRSTERTSNQRQTVQRQSAPRQNAQRRTVQRQPAQRESSQRQTVERQSTQRRSSSESSGQRSQSSDNKSAKSGSSRSESSSRNSRSSRDSGRRR